MPRLPFFNQEVESEKPAIYWQGGVHQTYKQLIAETNSWLSRLPSDSGKLIFLYVRQHPEAIAPLVACMASHHAVLLVTDGLPIERRQSLEGCYQPHIIIEADHQDSFSIRETDAAPFDIHPDISLLLSTSGSTGTPRSVKLTSDNLLSNASGIASVLDIDSNDNALVHLDLSYSYGLSVVTSHLLCGAALTVTSDKLVDKKFWSAVEEMEVTHFPGVPYHYETMCRLRLERLPLTGIKTFTQAGGRLSETFKERIADFSKATGSKFYVMYGQTEASPRMSTLRPEMYELHKDSVGQALPGGEFIIEDDQKKVLPAGSEGQIVFHGPNVMLGYGASREDLAVGDELRGVLRTGDTGFLDEDGFLTVTGRDARMGKIYGWRINLDELEREIEEHLSGCVVQLENNIWIGYIDSLDEDSRKELLNVVTQKFSLPVSVFKFVELNAIPTTSRNKTDYNSVLQLIKDQALK